MRSKWLVIIAGCVLLHAATSCRTVKEIEYQTDVRYVHDTVMITKTDSVHEKETVLDSVDRYVERIIYVDTNGVVHERELERMTRYIRESKEEFKAKQEEYERKIRELETRLAEKQTVVEVRKPLNWFQRTLVGLGVCFIIVLIGYAIYIYFKLKTKVKT